MKLEEALTQLTINNVVYMEDETPVAISKSFVNGSYVYYNFKITQWMESPEVDPLIYIYHHTWKIKNKASFDHNQKIKNIMDSWVRTKPYHGCQAEDNLYKLIELLGNIDPYMKEEV